MKAVDSTKCQTLFLSQIPQKALRQAFFPVGDLLKQDVKQLACEAGLQRIANRKEVGSLVVTIAQVFAVFCQGVNFLPIGLYIYIY